MDVLLLLLSLCGWAEAARSTWSNKPWIIVNSSDIVLGQWVSVLCGVPIDYTGGDCRLYRGAEHRPLRVQTTHDYTCHFLLSARQLLGRRRPGIRTTLRCDYKLQSFTSVSSDNKRMVIWETGRTPVLSVSSRLVSVDGVVAVNCSSPFSSSSCQFFSGGVPLPWTSCSTNLTGRQLSAGQEVEPLLPVRLSCLYEQEEPYIQSESSEPLLLLLLDVGRLVGGAASSISAVRCEAAVEEQQLAPLAHSSLPGGITLILQAANSSSPLNRTCTYV